MYICILVNTSPNICIDFCIHIFFCETKKVNIWISPFCQTKYIYLSKKREPKIVLNQMLYFSYLKKKTNKKKTICIFYLHTSNYITTSLQYTVLNGEPNNNHLIY